MFQFINRFRLGNMFDKPTPVGVDGNLPAFTCTLTHRGLTPAIQTLTALTEVSASDDAGFSCDDERSHASVKQEQERVYIEGVEMQECHPPISDTSHSNMKSASSP